jgi:putative lipoprotein (rSAM/lipoprotein system)
MATRISHGLLRGLAGLIGFLVSLLCGCRGAVEPLYGVAEYGMPWASYTVSGTVRARATQAAIPGIQIALRDTGAGQSTLGVDTADSAGRYTIAFSGPPWDDTWRLTAADIDADTNGLFGPRDTVLSIPESTLTGGDGHWDAGRGQKVVDLDLGPPTP